MRARMCFTLLVSMAALLALFVVSAGAKEERQAIFCYGYYPEGSQCWPLNFDAGYSHGYLSNQDGWQRSNGVAIRRSQTISMWPNEDCLPSYAQFRIRNVRANGTVVNKHNSAKGHCGVFNYNLTSNGEYAYAECRIHSTSGPVFRWTNCSTWWE